MGLFYGNKGVATANTNLVFDRVYSSFWSMQVNMKHDNIYYGRNVLIEYGNRTSSELAVEDIYLLAHMKSNNENFSKTYLYKSDVGYTDNEALRLKYGGKPQHPSDTKKGLRDEIMYGQIVKVIDKKNKVEYWVCCNEDKDQTEYALFKRLCVGDDAEYFKNRAIDICDEHGYSKDVAADYDSTVWQRVADTVNNLGYINIAFLNATLPTFYTGVEAPTEFPGNPHFSHDSGGIYYQLRLQPQFGFRIAEVEVPEGTHPDNIPSDVFIDVEKYVYPGNDTTKDPAISSHTGYGAIYFNADAFEIDGTKRRDDTTKNEIKLSLGESGKAYLPHYEGTDKNTHNNPELGHKDMQELTINLPIIGNVISDAYDIIYGEDRNGENNSLKGYLKVFEDLPKNSVPVKSEDGKLIGAALSSNHWIKATADATTKTFTINHEVPKASDEGETIYGECDSLTPTYGGTISIPAFSVDETGHVKKNIATQTITLPSISLTSGTGNLVTGLALTPDTGAFVASNANVGTLALTEYVNDTNNLISATDSINGAFKKLVDGLATETAGAATALANAKTELEGAYKAADASLKSDLEGQISIAKNTLTADYDTKIGNEATTRGTAITSLDSRLTTEVSDRKAAISAEQTARGNAITAAINKEVEDRNAAISSAIGVEVTNRGTAITSAITGEVTARNEAITNAINTEITNRDAAIKASIEALDVVDTAVEGQYVSQIVETDGKISVTRANLPDYSNKYDVNTKFTYNDTEMTIGDLFAKVADLEARLAALENPTV